MTSWRAERKLRILACCCLIAGGLIGFAPTAAAQTGMAAQSGPPTVADQELADHVQAALQSDPYFYGAHVTVSVEGGSVVLNGFVFSDWDLRDAVRIAHRAAGGRRVIDNLSIKVGGRR